MKTITNRQRGRVRREGEGGYLANRKKKNAVDQICANVVVERKIRERERETGPGRAEMS